MEVLPVARSRVVFHYPSHLIDEPIVSRLVTDYQLEFNLLRADITPNAEGLMVLGLEGTEENLSAGLAWVEAQGVTVQPLERDVVRDDELCTECGNCITICPTDALYRDAATQRVYFDPDKCIACELCVPVCPPRAMRVHF
jgi:ferredoxin